ncbi:fasciclin domain-containing protein [Christiangramia salexigens]|uniref:Fasciclin n=1 Tax=Christiangramia salexigens TaxID=1913577 RepID=A0A1L3J836_9FLAO|nr:fasciclin domain-containing protein [Christiangramia salexigens]APG61280.1 fasciclin [Christiangramia salexigens]
MKIKMFITMFALFAIVLTSCEDNKKKEQEENERIEQMEAEREAQMQAEKEKMEREANSIAAKAMETDTLSTLVSALESADMAEMFMVKEGPFTVFAPNNAAFDKVDDATLESLMKKENQDKLGELLKYHVVQGEITSEKLVGLINDNDGKYTFSTVVGADLTASLDGEKVILTDEAGNKVTVVQADVDASNGVVHIIDGVVMRKAS